MSRPQKIHPPIKAAFRQVLGAAAARKAGKNTGLLAVAKKSAPTANPN